MGIIGSQSIKNTLTTYFGFLIGGINVLFLYTSVLDKQYYGIVSYILTVANLLWPFIAFGIHNTLIKFYSSYTDKKDQDALLTLLLIIPLIVFSLFGLLFWLNQTWVTQYFEATNAILQPYIGILVFIALSMAYFEIFYAWVKVHLKSVYGNVLKEIFHRAAVMLLLGGVYFELVTVFEFINSLALVYGIRLVLIAHYAFSLYTPRFSINFPKNLKEILTYSGLIMIAGSVAVLMIDLDKFMIERYLPVGEVAVYGMCAYIASVIVVPSRAMHQIMYPLTAKLLNEGNFLELHKVYRQSSINLFVVSGLMALLIICNVKHLYAFIPGNYQLYMLVVFLISLAKLFENLIGNNNAILFSSKYYKSILVFGIFIVLIAVVLNLLLLPKFGLDGAAIATFVSLCSYNIIKLIFVQRKFNMQPFTRKTFITALILTIVGVVFYFWQPPVFPLIAILIKTILITVCYSFLIYKANVSPELSLYVSKLKAFVKSAS